MNYSLSSARASLPYSELIRIKIPKLSESDMQEIKTLEKDLTSQMEVSDNNLRKINKIATELL